MVRSHLKNYICTDEKELRAKNSYNEMLTIGISGQWVNDDFYFLLCLQDKHVLLLLSGTKTSLFSKRGELSPSTLTSHCHG